MTWHTAKPPRQGEYLAVDRIYRGRCVAMFRNDLGWCMRGRWLGPDAAECWQELPELPARKGR